MPHIVLLGDSIFDNAAYVPGEPDVIRQLRSMLPADWEATLCAIDGAVVSDVPRQLGRVPDDATHLVLSAGGNDVLQFVELLGAPARSFAEVLDTFASLAEDFERRYTAALTTILDLRLPLAVCTIYNGNLPDPAVQRRARTALAIFNDVILRAAAARRLPVIELRHVCTEPGDYANPIEPSSAGGWKICRAIVDLIAGE